MIKSIHETFTYFIGFITQTFYDCCPEKKNIYSNRLPWIDKNIKTKIVERERLLKIKINDPTEHNRKQFKEMRNHVISLQRRSERKYYREQLEINEHDLRKSWKILTHIIGKEEHSQTRKLEFNINNRVTSDSHSIANHFNNYFVNVGTNIAEKIVTHIDPLTYITYNAHQLKIPRIEEPEILNVIAQLKNSAAGHDSLPDSIIK